MRLKKRVRIIYKKAMRTEHEIEEHVWEIEDESPIGFRTIKTALSIFCCLVLFHLLQPFGLTDASDAFLACVTAIICMKDSVDESWQSGLYRLVGTFIGAVFGLLYLYINISFRNPYLNILLLSLCIIILISICNLVKSPQAVVICCVVFLFISLDQVAINPVIHSAKRFADTAAGLAISFLINRFLFNPDKRPALSDGESPDQSDKKIKDETIKEKHGEGL